MLALLLGMVKSFVVILFCSDIIRTATSEEESRVLSSLPESEHLCGKVMSGHFERIQLLSINPPFIFESHYRLLKSSLIGSDEYSLKLNDSCYDEPGVTEELGPIMRWFQANQVDEQIGRFYEIPFGWFRYLVVRRNGPRFMEPWTRRKVKYIYLAFTDRALYIWDVWPARLDHSKPIELWSRVSLTNDTFPEFALQYKFQNDSITMGYIIHKDINGHTDNFVISDFAFSAKAASECQSFWTKLSWKLLSFLTPIAQFAKHCETTKQDAEGKVFYYIEKTDSPGEIRFVHHDVVGSNGSTADRQLFRGSLPVGFEDNAAQYLFDGSLGCVYVVRDFDLSFTQQYQAGKVDIRLKRVNIPYEQYFKCPAKFKLAENFAHRPNRCDSVIGDDDDDFEPVIEQRAIVSSDRLFWTVLAIGVTCLAVAILIVALTVFRRNAKTSTVKATKPRIGRSNDLESRKGTIRTDTTTTSGTATGATSPS